MKTNTFPELLAAADARTVDLEAVAIGTPEAELLAAARSAERAAYAAASNTLVPVDTMPAVTMESLSDFDTFSGDGPRDRAPERLAALLKLAVAGKHRGLVVALRGPRAVRFIRACADSAAAADQAVERYITLVAGVLADEHPEESKAITVYLPALRERIAGAAARHEARRAAELARVDAEQRAAGEAIEAADRAVREEVAVFFANRPAWPFALPGGRGVVSGQAVAAIARRAGARDFNGDIVQDVTLDDLMVLKQQAEAAERIAADAAAKGAA